MSDERLMILKMIHDGKITPEQGESLLKALPSDTGSESRQPPPPPAPPPNFGSFFDLQGRLADVQVKLGELQSKLGAATSTSASSSTSSSGKSTVLPFGLGEVNVGQMIDEAVRGVNSLKSESVKTFKQAARTAQKEGRKIREDAKKAGKNIRIELNINFDDDGRPRNDAREPETVVTDTIPLNSVTDGSLKIVNRLGNVKVSSSTGNDPQLKFTRTAWSDNQEKLQSLNLIAPQLVNDSSGKLEQVLVDTDIEHLDDLTIDIELIVPESIRVDIETTFGDVLAENRLQGLGGVETQSGDVRLINIRGENSTEGTIRTRSGGITISQWEVSPLIAESVSGSIEVDGLVGTSATLRSRSGELSMSNLTVTDGVNLETSSSDIIIRDGNAAKEVAIRTQSGDVTVQRLTTTSARFESVSGDIDLGEVKSVDGGLNLKSVSGDIQVKALEAPTVSSTTISGDIDIAFAGPFSGALNASAISGDVTLSLLQGSDVHVDVSTQTGSIISRLDLEQLISNGSRFLSGNLGTGLGAIVLQTVSGDVTVKPQV